jgi:hypothetical protein
MSLMASASLPVPYTRVQAFENFSAIYNFLSGSHSALPVEQGSIGGWITHPIQSEGKENGDERLAQGMLATAIVLPALTSAARAGGTDDYGCSNATLKGEYAFGVSNFTIPQVVAGIKVFDGKTPGTLTQRDYIGDSVPAEFAPQGQEKGTYTVNSDCTGSMVINLNTFGVPPVTTQGGVINILFVISDGGRHIHEVVSELTPPGASGPEPVQTSADDWKVASQWSN